MELRHLRYFVTVAEELHFGRAAKRLYMAQPPLSQQIQQLEEELEVLLFKRSHRRVELTDAGQAFLGEAYRILDQVEQAKLLAQRTARGEVGKLALGFVSSTAFELLPRLLYAYREQYPQIHVSLHEYEANKHLRQELDACWNSTAHLFGGTPAPMNTGIHDSWVKAWLFHDYQFGPPITQEYKSVDSDGNPITIQECAHARCE